MADWRDKIVGLNQTEIADLVRSGNLTPEERRVITSWQLQALGGAAYMDLYPEVYKPRGGKPDVPAWTYSRIKRIQDEIGAFRELRSKFTGPEATYIRWLIDNKIRSLYNKVTRERAFLADLYRRETGEEHSGETVLLEPLDVPIPEWMKPYIESSTPAYREHETGEEKPRLALDKTTKGAEMLRPLGAQEELTPEQMGQMAGYLAWGRAGSPRTYQSANLRKMANWREYWDEYIRLSKELFPSQVKLGTNWAIARQK